METAGLLGISVTLLLALIGAVWKFASIATKLETKTDALSADAARVSENLKGLEAIPPLLVRVGNIESGVTKLSSEFPKLRERMATVEQRIGSTDKFRARLESIHDRGEDK